MTAEERPWASIATSERSRATQYTDKAEELLGQAGRATGPDQMRLATMANAHATMALVLKDSAAMHERWAEEGR